MIVDLEKRGSRQMFVTERVSAISRSRNGLLAVQFAGSMRVFNYNPSRLLYLTDPETIDIGRKVLCINHGHSQPGNDGKNHCRRYYKSIFYTSISPILLK